MGVIKKVERYYKNWIYIFILKMLQINIQISNTLYHSGRVGYEHRTISKISWSFGGLQFWDVLRNYANRRD